MNTVLRLIEQGQSYWMDNLSRGMIKSGELERRVREEGLRGITSNPKIFDGAISGSSDYDDQVSRLVKDKRAIHEIYEELIVKDVQDACDILRQVFEESDGVDGFVSLEVSPYLAHDTKGTMNEVRRLFKAVDRPNVFIKIPGTSEGVPAIEQMLYEGINVNITLLFSIESYEAVANAYIRALEQRVADGKPIKNIASVASFFLSRIDVLVDNLLGHLIIPELSDGQDPRPEQLLGKVAVANAKLAYQNFKKIFSGDRWRALSQKGARVQRPLWASTSTKNSLYSDVRYVEPLIGPDTVNTMPEKTIKAFGDHGAIEENSVERNIEGAKQILDDLKKVGIDLNHVTRQLINEGVQKFIDPYDDLMETLAKNRQEILKETLPHQTLFHGVLESVMTSGFDELDNQKFTRRLFARDPSLWKPDTEHVDLIRERLGWLNDIEKFRERINEIKGFANEVRNEDFTHTALLGIEGSTLFADVCRNIFAQEKNWPNIFFADNTDPTGVIGLEKEIDPKKTLFVVCSKSGATLETMTFHKFFYELKKQVNDDVGKHFAAVTDSGSPLEEEAVENGFRKIFKNPHDIGARYSALSYFGLVPMALMGIDIEKILAGAFDMKLSCGPFIPAIENPGVSLGLMLGLGQKRGCDKITFVLSPSLKSFGNWVERLLAESTGKNGKGLIPLVGEQIGGTELYSQDRLFVYMYTSDERDKDLEKRIGHLQEAGRPAVRIEIKDKWGLGAEFYRWEIASCTAGAVIGVNPFAGPEIVESKKHS